MKPNCVLFVIPRKAKASLLAGCFSRSFRGRVLTLHGLAVPGGSRAGLFPQSRGTQPYLGAGRGQRAASARTRPGRPGKTAPAVPDHGFGGRGGGGKASPGVLGVAARTEPARNTAFNFLRGRERDINSE